MFHSTLHTSALWSGKALTNLASYFEDLPRSIRHMRTVLSLDAVAIKWYERPILGAQAMSRIGPWWASVSPCVEGNVQTSSHFLNLSLYWYTLAVLSFVPTAIMAGSKGLGFQSKQFTPPELLSPHSIWSIICHCDRLVMSIASYILTIPSAEPVASLRPWWAGANRTADTEPWESPSVARLSHFFNSPGCESRFAN